MSPTQMEVMITFLISLAFVALLVFIVGIVVAILMLRNLITDIKANLQYVKEKREEEILQNL